MACSDCHQDISAIPHPEQLKKPLCATCHSSAVEVYGKSIHGIRRMACDACHNTHFITRGKKDCIECHRGVAHASLPSSQKHLEALPCLTCHGTVQKSAIEIGISVHRAGLITPELIDPDRNAMVDKLEWDNLLFLLSKQIPADYTIKKEYRVEGDVHSIMRKPAQCTRCHEGKGYFSKAQLKVSGALSYVIPMNARVFIPLLPSIKDYKKTVHGKKGIQCSACHTSQKQVDDNVCIGCHRGLYTVYKDTPHAQKGATRCMDCHNPHLVKPYRELSSHERVAVCASCHKNYLHTHEWLPHTYLHFKYLECSTCHSPYSEKGIVFHMKAHGKGGMTPLSYKDLSSIFEIQEAPRRVVDTDNNGTLDAKELHDFFITLKKHLQDKVSINASIVVTRIYHDHAVRGNRKRVCKECHSSGAPFYDSMYLALPDRDKLIYLPVKGTSLSMLPIAVFVDLVLLGETKATLEDVQGLLMKRGDAWYTHVRSLGYKWIDLIGIIALCCVVAGIIIHIGLRIGFRR